MINSYRVTRQCDFQTHHVTCMTARAAHVTSDRGPEGGWSGVFRLGSLPRAPGLGSVAWRAKRNRHTGVGRCQRGLAAAGLAASSLPAPSGVAALPAPPATAPTMAPPTRHDASRPRHCSTSFELFFATPPRSVAISFPPMSLSPDLSLSRSLTPPATQGGAPRRAGAAPQQPSSK